MNLLTASPFLHHALQHANKTVDELDEVEWPHPLSTSDRGWSPPPLEWLFGSFLLCMAIAALPLLGMRWTLPGAMRLGAALTDTVVLSLPVVVPLPFLFLGCAAALILEPRSRTPAAFAAFGAAMAIGLTAAHALLG
ncbi:hypothetical protein [Variovorax defluvii]